jgi:hypothetical protein
MPEEAHGAIHSVFLLHLRVAPIPLLSWLTIDTGFHGRLFILHRTKCGWPKPCVTFTAPDTCPDPTNPILTKIIKGDIQ